jgi:hypothetical protein
MKTIFLVTLSMLVVSCGNKLSLTEQKELMKLESELKIVPGRYQYVAQSDGFINHGKLIDTATGKIWHDACYKKDKAGKCLASAWTEETVIGVTISNQDYNRYLELVFPDREPANQK